MAGQTFIKVGGVMKPTTGGASVPDVCHPPLRFPTGSVFPVTNYGAVLDGTTNDFDALDAAVNAAYNAGGGTVTIPAGAKMKVATRTAGTGSWIWVGNNITIRGLSTTSEIQYYCGDASFSKLFHVEGSNVRIQDLILRRMSDVFGFMVHIEGASASGFAMDSVTIDGNHAAAGGSDFSGIQLYGNAEEVMSSFMVTRSTFARLPTYGVVRQSTSKVSIEGATFDMCTFDQQGATDLELNAPNSDTPSVHFSNVNIKRCRFMNNRGTGSAAGFAIGMAGVYGGAVDDCTFYSYQGNPVHIEDETRNITITNNRFKAVATTDTNFNAPVFIVSGAHDLDVSGNNFDLAGQNAGSDGVDLVYIGPGGAGFADPYNITMTNNLYRAASTGATRTYSNYGSGTVTASGFTQYT